MNGINRTRGGTLVVLLAVLGMVASTVQAAPTSLSNGVAVTGISGAAGSEKFYMIEVPSGQDELEISTSGGTGDVDLYVRRGSAPTTTSYDYRPFEVGNNETVKVENPTAGTWFIMLRGYTSYSGVTLKASYSADIVITPLVNGVPVTDLTGDQGSEKYFRIEVPAGQTKLEIAISGGTGDADLYVRKGALPTTSEYDYRPFLFGNDETVTINDPEAGTWYIMVRGYNLYAGVTLLASHGGGVGTLLQNGVPVTDISGSAGGEKIFRIEVPAGQTSLDIKMWGGTGDADLYVKYGARPTETDYDYRPFLAGNDESVSVNNPTAGTWYVMIRGYSNFTGVTLRATYSDVFTLQDGVPITGISGALNSEKFYKIEVPSGQSHLVFRIFGGTGNADLYIRRGAKPTTSTWDYRPTQPGNTESISIGNPNSGTWYVMLKGQKAYEGLTLEADYSFTSDVVTLENGVPVTDISGGAGHELFFKIEVPANQQKLEIMMSGGTGDADMYVKRGSLPSMSEYDYRPYQPGNDEKVTINNPSAGTYFIMIRAYQPFSGITLVASYGGAPPDQVVTLQNGVPVTGISGAEDSRKFYKIEVPAGQAKLEIMTTGGTGDLDLYVRRGQKPSTSEWDYRPYLTGSNESVTIDNPQAGTWYIMLHGYTAYSGVTLKATYFPVPEEVTELTNGVPVTGLSGAASSEEFFKIVVPPNQDFLDIEMSGGTGDADLYVRKGSKPTKTSWDYRPFLIGNDESVEIGKPAAATWYIMVRGYGAYSGVSLVATYGVEHVGNNFASDPNAVALWRFEPGELIVDSLGDNTLEVVNTVGVETSDYQEGEGAADVTMNGHLDIPDANLSPDFPLRSDDKDKDFSVAFWMKAATGSEMANGAIIYGKGAGGQYSFAVGLRERSGAGSGHLIANIGVQNGLNHQILQNRSKTIERNQWYHVVVTYTDEARDKVQIVLYDPADDSVEVTDHLLPPGEDIHLSKADVKIGAYRYAGHLYEGLVDELVVFNDVLTLDEMAKIREGTYGKP